MTLDPSSRCSTPEELTAPPGGLEGLLRAAVDRPGLACLDLDGRYTVTTWGAGPTATWRVGAPGSWLDAARQLGGAAPATGLPLPGGIVGWLGYEAGVACERMPAPRGPRPLPDVALWRVHGAVVLDREQGRWWLHGGADFRAQARAVLAVAGPGGAAVEPLPAPPAPPPGQAERYQQAVARAKAQIAAGRVYQVNLAWELTAPAVRDPVGAWLALRRANPATNGALLRYGQAWVLSNSPERYLHLRPGDGGLVATSVPIKGTAPRSAGAAGRRRLETSTKERAELTMIVDLVRNDLGRVAVVGGVEAGPRRIRACGDLWHAEQEVTARLRPGVDPWDVVGASFPPGSVTGAPKVAAMDQIAALEAGPRGVYTGALVALGDDGEGWLSVAIRTATLVEDRVRLHVGAGIVADSQPEAEWLETLAKGRVLARYVARAP